MKLTPPNPYNVENDGYDAHLIPAETAARIEREGDRYKNVVREDESADPINATGGHTVDSEGLTNNYAIEPEMYYEKPGDVNQSEPITASEHPKHDLHLEVRAKATIKEIEGKVEEAVGYLTGNAEIQAIGQAKQAEAHQAIENIDR